MENKEILKKAQEIADETSKKYLRKAYLTLIHVEDKEDGSQVAYCLSSDAPNLIYRVFLVTKDGEVSEVTDTPKAGEYTNHFRNDILPHLTKVKEDTNEELRYEIMNESRLDNGMIELKLKSNTSRYISMVEIYRYFDYKSKVFFVFCMPVSFGWRYLFAVDKDSKHVVVMSNLPDELNARVAMINELFSKQLLPTYQNIKVTAEVLSGQVKGNISLNDNEGKKHDFECKVCYDDDATQSRYAFFGDVKDASKGVIFIQDILNLKSNTSLIPATKWTKEQQEAAERIKKEMAENSDEAQKHYVSFFADNLDYRYNAYKAGKLVSPVDQAKAEEKPAEEKPAEENK